MQEIIDSNGIIHILNPDIPFLLQNDYVCNKIIFMYVKGRAVAKRLKGGGEGRGGSNLTRQTM
jgi:hypothetical protein